MPTKILIQTGGISVKAELNDTPCAKAIAEALPIEGSASRWGEEIYFDIPVKRKLEDGARDQMEVGELGYWPTGSAFCVFFGPTPASSGDKPVAASDVNVIGKTIGDATTLASSKNGDKITIAAE